MNKLFFCLLVLSSTISSYGQKVAKTPIVLGEQLNFKSTNLKENRTLNIYLPPSYATNKDLSYPVVYLLDGSINEDFIHISGLVQFQSFPWINKVPEAIVVGIANVDRTRDFTYPSTVEIDRKELPTSGSSASFIAFLNDEVKPLVEKTYRTNGSDTLIGQSLGGLLAVEILYRHSQMFDNFLIVSPSLWWDKEQWLLAEPQYMGNAKSVYISVGNEGDAMKRTALSLYERLDLMLGDQHSINYHFFESLDHGDTLHQAAYSGLETIFTSRRK